jgi:hypothetical protein
MAKLTNNQYSINRQSIIDSEQTNSWLKQNNIKPETLNDHALLTLHATLIATKTLRNQMQHISVEQVEMLNDFLNKIHTTRNIPYGTTYKVLNICTIAKRNEAKYLRQAKNKLFTIS